MFFKCIETNREMSLVYMNPSGTKQADAIQFCSPMDETLWIRKKQQIPHTWGSCHGPTWHPEVKNALAEVLAQIWLESAVWEQFPMVHCEMQRTNWMVTQLLRRSIQYFIDSLDEGMDCAFIKSAKIKSVKSGCKYMGESSIKKFWQLGQVYKYRKLVKSRVVFLGQE